MDNIVIRDLDDPLTRRRRGRAADRGRSMAEEVLLIPSTALTEPSSSGTVGNGPAGSGDAASGDPSEVIRHRFRPLGGVDPPETAREVLRNGRGHR